MSDFLSRLAERTLGLAEPVQPRIAPLFAAPTDLQVEEGDTLVAPQRESPIPAHSTMPAKATVERPFDAERTVFRGPTAQAPGEVPKIPAMSEPERAITLPASRPGAPPAEPNSEPVPRHAQSVQPVRHPEPPLLVPTDRPLPHPGEAAPIATPPAPRGSMASATVRVTIGRVEVRAIFPAPEPPRPVPEAPKPGLTLDEYVKQRRDGTR